MNGRRSRSRAAAIVSVVVALGAIGSSCGVPVDRGDRPLRANEVAYTPRTEPAPTTTVTTTTATTAVPAASTTAAPTTTVATAVTTPTPVTSIINAALDVYWVDGSLLAPVRRLATEASLPSAVGSLQAGPQSFDTARGLRSAIPTAETITGAVLTDGTATIALAGSFLTLPGREQVLAIAQVVFTVTSVPGIVRVEFLLDSEPMAVPRADGQPASGTVSRQDYASLLVTPLPPVAPTTVLPVPTTVAPAPNAATDTSGSAPAEPNSTKETSP